MLRAWSIISEVVSFNDQPNIDARAMIVRSQHVYTWCKVTDVQYRGAGQRSAPYQNAKAIDDLHWRRSDNTIHAH